MDSYYWYNMNKKENVNNDYKNRNKYYNITMKYKFELNT